MIVAVILAIASSAAYGVSSMASGLAVRRHATAALALWAQVTGLVVLGAATLGHRPDAAPAMFGWGAAAGAVGALAVLAFYTAQQKGSTAVVTPIAGSGIVLPVLAGFVQGEPVGWQVGAGVAAAILGILIVSNSGSGVVATPGRDQPAPVHDGCVPRDTLRSRSLAVPFAVVAAIGFGSFFLIVDRATAAAPADVGTVDAALVIALAVQIGALAVTAVAATRHTRTCLRPDRALLLPAVLIGMLDVVADFLITLAVGLGPLAVIGPLGSLDPVITVLLATFVFRERLRPVPLTGVAVASAGILLIATG